MKRHNEITFSKNHTRSVLALPVDQAGRLFKAILRYAEHGTLADPGETEEVKRLFDNFKADIDRTRK